ncbi:hypothetical protein [Acutalibacter sp. 1XD8-36]|uniref:hypothetical protein n=1 Tax=Acutalibacter sp. 1XD8-36 TaxID=2320852 RepID=UPI003FA4297C
MFERDKLDPADSMRIERNIYFEEQTADLSGLTALPLEQLQALREEYAAAEQAAFEALQEQAAAWDEQAGKTLAIDKAIEYVRTPEATHTANQWEATDYGKHISNRVYQMRYHISENTRYDREKEKSIDLQGFPRVKIRKAILYTFTTENGVLLRNIHENSTHKKTGRGSHILASAPCSFFAYLTFPFSISSSGNCGRASISFFVMDWRISSLISCFVLPSGCLTATVDSLSISSL